MIYKVIREVFTNHKGEKLKKGETFVIDDDNYNLKTFYKRRILDGDIKEVIENKKEIKKIIQNNNKTEEK